MEKRLIVKSITAYIEEQLTHENAALSLDEVANKMGYSKFYLNRVFQEETRMTIHRYISERRLSEAARKLVYTDKPIVEIAYETGYQSQQAFTDAFGSRYLCTPLKYRMDKRYYAIRKPYEARSALRLSVSGRWAVAA